jgi:VanZ family protein
MSAELACIYFVKLTRAINSGNAEAIYKMDLLVRNQLKDLKATKDKREGEASSLQTTPAEWAASLLEEYRKLTEKSGKIRKEGHICEPEGGGK